MRNVIFGCLATCAALGAIVVAFALGDACAYVLVTAFAAEPAASRQVTAVASPPSAALER